MPDSDREALSRSIATHARALGFDLVGICPATALPHRDAFERWLDDEFHGEMGYLERRRALRIDPRGVLPSARSVLAVAMTYHQACPAAIASYARGADYHGVFRDRLRVLAAFVKQQAGAHVRTRWCIDSAPLLERDVAWLAGLGWVGKNSCLMHPRLGSFLLLAELCLSVELAPIAPPSASRASDAHGPMRSHCGTCRACLDQCPTGALVAPYRLDARRCISYLTIELRGPIPRHLRPAIGELLFGCDICQDVCPWNRKAPATKEPAFRPLEAVRTLTPETLLELTEEAFDAAFGSTPLARAGHDGMARNACVVLGNRADPRAVALLAATLAGERSELVRGHAAWALGRIATAAARHALEQALEALQRAPHAHAFVLEEVRAALTPDTGTQGRARSGSTPTHPRDPADRHEEHEPDA